MCVARAGRGVRTTSSVFLVEYLEDRRQITVEGRRPLL